MVANVGVTHPDYIMVRHVSSEPRDNPQGGEGGMSSEEREEELPAGAADGREGPVTATPSEVPRSETGGGGMVAREGVGESGVDQKQRKVRNGNDVSREKVERAMSSEELLQPTLQALAVLSNVCSLIIIITPSLSLSLPPLPPSFPPSLLPLPLSLPSPPSLPP